MRLPPKRTEFKRRTFLSTKVFIPYIFRNKVSIKAFLFLSIFDADKKINKFSPDSLKTVKNPVGPALRGSNFQTSAVPLLSRVFLAILMRNLY